MKAGITLLAALLAAAAFATDLSFSDAPQTGDSAGIQQQRMLHMMWVAATAQTAANASLATIAGNSASASNSYRNITTATTTLVKSGAGTLRSVTVNALGTVASTVTLYDNTAGSGTKIATISSLSVLGTLTYEASFAAGLTVVTTGTVAPDVTVSYR